ncbi:MAG TPA: TonB-dependent receptor [Rhizomicrobium sp.]|jgi:iron complex outermembrane receptor protein|nr:TonB-dependent receptor [Rhizomicrobium sp.]
MSGRFRNSVSLAALTVGIISVAQTAQAQIETVTVTAERRDVDLQKTTLAATVLTADDLDKKSVMGLTALQNAAPGITINDYGSANVFNMRGVGREAVDVEIPSGVAIYRDGVPTLAGYFQGEPYFDMAGIEVLRGPQGTLAGQSASGGALFIRTADPDTHGYRSSVQFGIGNYDATEGQFMVNAPLGDDAAIRIAFNHSDRGSMYKITGSFTGSPNERDLNNLRVGLAWNPGAWNIVLKTDIGQDDFGGNPVSTPGAPLFSIKLDDPMAYVDKSIRQVADVRYTFADGTSLRSLTGIQNVSTVNNLDADGGGPPPGIVFPAGPIVPAAINPTGHNAFRSQGNFFFYSEELDLVSPSDQRFRWVLGAFAERQVSLIPDYNVTGQDGFTFTGFSSGSDAFPFFATGWRMIEDDLAVFANTEYDITPDLTLETGLRGSYNGRKSTTSFTFGFGTTPPFIGIDTGAGGGPGTATSAGDYLDGKVALQWKPTEDDFVYLTGSRGHTVKGINIFPPHDVYRPVEVWNYEVGWKTSLFDDHMRTQIDAYYEDIGNYQAVFGLVIPGALVPDVSETRNAESRSKIWGIEASGQGQWGDFGLDFGAAYLNSKIGKFTDIINPFSVAPVQVAPLPAPPVVLGNPVAAAEAAAFGNNCDTGSGLVTLTGSKAPFSPEITANVGAQYAIHSGGVTVTPRADVSYASENQANLFACSLETIKARTLVNLQMRVESEDSPWWASLWMTNVADLKYVAAVQNIPPIYYAGPRRQFGIRIGRSFE